MTWWHYTILLWVVSTRLAFGAGAPKGMVSLPGGLWQPPFETKKGAMQPVSVAPFWLDAKPVTAQQFLEFIHRNPQWQRGNVDKNQADAGYLRRWDSPTKLGEKVAPDSPAVEVSWFAAKSYCQSLGRRLPTEAEWEWAATASIPKDSAAQTTFRQKILNWYAQPSRPVLPTVGRDSPDLLGLYDLYGLVWEWVDDFNGSIINTDSRGEAEGDKIKFCGSGALSAKDREDYPVFMRFAFRSSLKKGNFTTANLGFRCAQSANATFYDQRLPFITTESKPLAWNNLKGNTVWIAMFYASCNYACPLLLQNLKMAWEKLPAKTRDKTQVVLVTFDSDKDTPQRLADFAKSQSMPKQRWTLASGNPDSVRNLAAHLGITYRRMDDGEFSHASVVTLLDPSGQIVTEEEGGKPLSEAFIEKTVSTAP